VNRGIDNQKTHPEKFYFDGKYHNPINKDYEKVKKKIEYEKEILEVFGCLPLTKQKSYNEVTLKIKAKKQSPSEMKKKARRSVSK